LETPSMSVDRKRGKDTTHKEKMNSWLKEEMRVCEQWDCFKETRRYNRGFFLRTPQPSDAISANTDDPGFRGMPDGVQDAQRVVHGMGALDELQGHNQRVHH